MLEQSKLEIWKSKFNRKIVENLDFCFHSSTHSTGTQVKQVSKPDARWSKASFKDGSQSSIEKLLKIWIFVFIHQHTQQGPKVSR